MENKILKEKAQLKKILEELKQIREKKVYDNKIFRQRRSFSKKYRILGILDGLILHLNGILSFIEKKRKSIKEIECGYFLISCRSVWDFYVALSQFDAKKSETKVKPTASHFIKMNKKLMAEDSIKEFHDDESFIRGITSSILHTKYDRNGQYFFKDELINDKHVYFADISLQNQKSLGCDADQNPPYIYITIRRKNDIANKDHTLLIGVSGILKSVINMFDLNYTLALSIIKKIENDLEDQRKKHIENKRISNPEWNLKRNKHLGISSLFNKNNKTIFLKLSKKISDKSDEKIASLILDISHFLFKEIEINILLRDLTRKKMNLIFMTMKDYYDSNSSNERKIDLKLMDGKWCGPFGEPSPYAMEKITRLALFSRNKYEIKKQLSYLFTAFLNEDGVAMLNRIIPGLKEKLSEYNLTYFI